MGGVESFTTENAADCSSVGSSIDLSEDSLFVVDGEVSPDRSLDDFGVGDDAAAAIRQSGSFGLASLALTPHSA